MPADLDDETVTVGSGNVFADIGVPDPELALAKAKLCIKIYETIQARGWTQRQAASAMGIDQPKVSEIIRGRVRRYTIDRLMGYLEKLGYGVEFRYFDLARSSPNGRSAVKPRKAAARRGKSRKAPKATTSV